MGDAYFGGNFESEKSYSIIQNEFHFMEICAKKP